MVSSSCAFPDNRDPEVAKFAQFQMLSWKSPFKVKLLLKSRASLVVQWLRICLPMQGTQVSPLVQEDPTCHSAAKPMHLCSRAHMP